MATLSQTVPARPMKTFAGRRGLVDKYFYFTMSLLFPAIVVWGFSRTINENGFRLLSAYTLNTGTKIWIITEADRSATTVLLPEEY